jgi:hypothetical protein
MLMELCGLLTVYPSGSTAAADVGSVKVTVGRRPA